MNDVLKVKVYDPNDSNVNVKDFKFPTAKNIEKRRGFKRATRILSFEDPENPDEPINILVRALTDNEEAILYQLSPQLNTSDIQSLVSVFLERTEKGEKIEESDITNLIAEKITQTPSADAVVLMERFYRRLQMAIEKPRGVTIEWLKRRNPNVLDIINDTIDELKAEAEIWSREWMQHPETEESEVTNGS